MFKQIIMMVVLGIVLSGCPNGHDRWDINFLDVSDYDYPDSSEVYHTTNGVQFWHYDNVDHEQVVMDIARAVSELEECTGFTFDREKFMVLIPEDYYLSTCSEKQLLPVAADPELCRDKGLEVPEQCEWLSRPTPECPCVCNYRAVVQDNYVIVTTPNLEIFKHELLSMYLRDRNLWNSEYSECLRFNPDQSVPLVHARAIK